MSGLSLIAQFAIIILGLRLVLATTIISPIQSPKLDSFAPAVDAIKDFEYQAVLEAFTVGFLESTFLNEQLKESTGKSPQELKGIIDLALLPICQGHNRGMSKSLLMSLILVLNLNHGEYLRESLLDAFPETLTDKYLSVGHCSVPLVMQVFREAVRPRAYFINGYLYIEMNEFRPILYTFSHITKVMRYECKLLFLQILRSSDKWITFLRKFVEDPRFNAENARKLSFHCIDDLYDFLEWYGQGEKGPSPVQRRRQDVEAIIRRSQSGAVSKATHGNNLPPRRPISISEPSRRRYKEPRQVRKVKATYEEIHGAESEVPPLERRTLPAKIQSRLPPQYHVRKITRDMDPSLRFVVNLRNILLETESIVD